MLIEANQLKSLIDDNKVVAFDCRFSLAEPSKGLNEYVAGHIPGAHYLHLEHDLSSPVKEHGGRHPLPGIDEFVGKLRHAGVTNEKPVVVYDAGGGMAPRAWWFLSHLGHPDVRVLNGGYPAWVKAGYPVEDTVGATTPSDFTAQVQSHETVTVDDVEAIVAGKADGVLVDARAANRYRGEVEPLDKAAGHIPGAWNAPWEQGLDSEGRWLSPEAQRSRFADVLREEKPLVMYCGSGVSACANLFALHLAGVKGAKLYPGSWSDWSSYPEHPIATGERQ